MPEVQNSKAFNQVKKKLGKWEGKMTQGLTGAVYDVSYEFKLTSPNIFAVNKDNLGLRSLPFCLHKYLRTLSISSTLD